MAVILQLNGKVQPHKPSKRGQVSRPLDAVVAGYLGVDLAPGFHAGRQPVAASEFFRPGKLIETEGLTILLGGVVANTGLAMKQFGRRVELMACIGDDALGDIVMAQLRERGAASGVRRGRGARTAYGIVVAPPGMDRIFFEDPGCNAAFSAADLDYHVIANCRLFHFGYPPLMKNLWADNGAELVRIFKRVRKLGVATSLDMTLPDSGSPAGQADWQAILAVTLPFVDIFMPSIEEILFMLEPKVYARFAAAAMDRDRVDDIPADVFARLADRILAFGVKVVMIKAGHRGAYIRTGAIDELNAATSFELPAGDWNQRTLWVDPFPVEPQRFKNACGAGDCAVAGFLTAMLNGERIEQAGRYAMLAGRDNLYSVYGHSQQADWRQMSILVARQSRAAKANGRTCTLEACSIVHERAARPA